MLVVNKLSLRGSGVDAYGELAYLEGQLTRVAEHHAADFPGHRTNLLQDREYEDDGLAHARLGLAQHVHAQDCLRDAFMLH